MALDLNSTIPIANSKHPIPRLGFGVYLSPVSVCVKSCLKAIECGYRHIDTAQYYENEAQVGQAQRESGLARHQLYLTSKILFPGHDRDSTYQKIVESVEQVSGGGGGGGGNGDDGASNPYFDLFLIHSPNGGASARKLMWQALEKAKEEGLVRNIGVSNYGIQQIEEIKSLGTVWPPAVNQIELHPWCQQREVVSYCQKNNILLQAYSPLVRNQKADDKTLVRISDKHRVGPNQVLVRWSLQKGFVPLPKSDTPDRIAANADVFAFELDHQDMADLDGLDQGKAGAIVQAVSNE